VSHEFLDRKMLNSTQHEPTRKHVTHIMKGEVPTLCMLWAIANAVRMERYGAPVPLRNTTSLEILTSSRARFNCSFIGMDRLSPFLT
jgi:hypothetical protein